MNFGMAAEHDDQPAIMPRVARLAPDMKHFTGPVRAAQVLDPAGKPLLGGDHDRRFFEASWMFKRNGKYYFTYSTGDTHFLIYATGSSPWGPFTYQGKILLPVEGWTSHHSILKIGSKWYLFYHDTQISHDTRLRSAKVTELHFNPDGSIQTIDPFTG